nr:MAG TPA: conotoxin [Caudoviricetes sp.]
MCSCCERPSFSYDFSSNFIHSFSNSLLGLFGIIGKLYLFCCSI